MTTPNPFEKLHLLAQLVRAHAQRGETEAAMIEIDRLIIEADTLALLHRTEPLPVEVDG